MGSLWDIGRKQLEDTFSSNRFVLILGLFLVLSMGSVYMGVSEYQQALEQFRDGGGVGAVPEKPSLIEVFGPMVGLNLPLAAGILALLMSYDVISGEREEGTIELLLSYPVYRDEVINGKFVAGLFTVAVSLLIAFTASTGLAIFMTGQLPRLENVYRIMLMWHGSIVYMAFFFGLGTLFSALFRSRWRSLMAGLVVLVVCIGTPFLAGMAAEQLYPYPDDPAGGGGGVGPPVQRGDVVVESSSGTSSGTTARMGPGIPSRPDPGDRRREIREQRQRFTELVSRFSPAISYRNYATTMLGTDYEGEEGLEPGVMDSLESGGGYIVFLLAEAMFVFTLAYGVFMRQDL
jgi:ABC-2 type transport system permease protein